MSLSDLHFVTGQPRSGTTLTGHLKALDKPFLNQTLTLFFYELFGNDNRFYPFVPDNIDYIHVKLLKRFSESQIKEIVSKSFEYSGVYGKEYLNKINVNIQSIFDILESFKPCVFKEVFAEDLIPYFVEKGIPCTLIIRDPRDVIASLLQGDQMGGLRGVYYHLLFWRKSVAYYHEYQNHELVECIKLEELSVPESTEFNNSNFMNQETSSRLSFLETEMKAFIEQICFPEMIALGYISDRPEQIEIKEPLPNYPKNFPDRWVYDQRTAIMEKKRIEYLLHQNHLEDEVIRTNFIFNNNFKKLQF